MIGGVRRIHAIAPEVVMAWQVRRRMCVVGLCSPEAVRVDVLDVMVRFQRGGLRRYAACARIHFNATVKAALRIHVLHH